MGDRVLFQVVEGSAGFGPVVYCHWSGNRASDIVRKLAARMAGRPGDMDYATARLVQECTAEDPDGAMSFGVYNTRARLTREDSHGDAGVVLIDCDNGFRCECLGGYLRVDAEGMPCA